MPKTSPATRHPQFGGIVTQGHPLQRPKFSAVRCRDFRIMPGGYLRLKGGRKLRLNSTASFRQFYEFRRASQSGGVLHLCQRLDGGAAKWQQLSLSTYATTDVETISQLYGYSDPARAPITTVRNRVFWGNGLGVRGATSQPPVSSWDGTTLRYVGLDCYCPTARPVGTFFTGGATDYNNVTTSVAFYVGLYNTATGHFSNGVLAGYVVNATPDVGPLATRLNITSLSNLSYATHGAAETAELRYVFYATLDGGDVPYLILNAAGTDIFSVAVGTASVDLNLTNTTDQGFILDLTQEMPTENFPPRPMHLMAYSHGRVYGALMPGGGGTGYRTQTVVIVGKTFQIPAFQYVTTDRELAAVVWSAAASDYRDHDFTGNPDESFPYSNLSYTPNGERPLLIDNAPSSDRVLVITKTGTFFLEEQADGLHDWTTVSEVDGLLDIKTYVKSPYGPLWITQNKQLVRLNWSTEKLEVLSEDYADILSWPGQSPIADAADYLRDPANAIDQYRVWRFNGTQVIHDFKLGGMCYENTGPNVTAAGTLTDANGNRHHLMANTHLWTQEGDPLTGLIPTRDQESDGTFTEPTGDFIGQWRDEDDPELRKQLFELQIQGDGAKSDVLEDTPLDASWYADLGSVENVLEQSFDEQQRRSDDEDSKGVIFPVREGHARFFKFRIQLRGHSNDGVFDYSSGGNLNGEAPLLTYGCVFEMRPVISPAGNNR